MTYHFFPFCVSLVIADLVIRPTYCLEQTIFPNPRVYFRKHKAETCVSLSLFNLLILFNINLIRKASLNMFNLTVDCPLQSIGAFFLKRT